MHNSFPVAILGILYIVIVWFWIQYLPGYFVSRALVPDARGMARHGLALICGFSLIPLVVFLLTVFAGIPMDAPLCWLVASAVNIGGAILIVPPAQWKSMLEGCRELAGLGVAAIAIGLFLLFGLRSLDGGDVFSTVHHCLYVIVMHTIANDPSVSVPLYDWLSGDVIHYLVHHPTTEFNGLAPLFFEQRLGNAPILAPAVALFGSAGWYVATVHASVVTGACVYLAALELNVRKTSAAISAAIFVYGMHLFLMYFVNENLYAVALVAFLMWAALKKELGIGWIVICGIVCGHLVGVRYTSCLFWPAAAAFVLWQPGPWKPRLRRFAVGAFLALLFLAPWLYVNSIMLDGAAISHPKIDAQFASRIVENTFMGARFEFRALNWPFADSVFRTAWNPFPSFIWLPLWCGLCFGQLSLALGLMGAWQLRTQKRAFILLALFALPHSIAITLLESLDWEQITYAAPGLVALGPLLALGIDGFFAAATRRKWALTCLAVLCTITLGSWALRGLSFPVDTRILSKEVWPEAPPTDKGTDAVADMLTSPSPLPRLPVFRTQFAASMWGAFGHVLAGSSVDATASIPTYPSGQVAVLAGYATRDQQHSTYQFVVEGGPLRTADQAIRSSLGLHLVTFMLPAEKAKVVIIRNRGAYTIRVTPLGTASANKDFSFWLHPWFPPVKRISVTIVDHPNETIRVLKYGGSQDEGEKRFIVTNYPAETIDIIALPYSVDFNEEKNHCGLFLFTHSVDPSRVETLVLAGGHDQSWMGDRTGTITVPRHILADSVVLYSEPYCTDHVPQYGDRYGRVKGPFVDGQSLRFKLSDIW